MEDPKGRVRIKNTNDETVIIIKSHNSILHSLFLLLVVGACFSITVILFAIMAAFVGRTPLASGLAWTLAGIDLIFKATVAFIILRALLWTLFGREIIRIGASSIKYKKSIAGIGIWKKFMLDSVEYVKEIDSVKPKDIIHMLESETRVNGRSFMLKTDKTILKFGLYLTTEENEEIFVHIKK